MAKKKTPGLVRRGRIWHFDKTIDGRRIQGSTGTRCLDEAEAVLSHNFNHASPGQVLRHSPTAPVPESGNQKPAGGNEKILAQ
jgi:hypothetical protein